MGGFERQRDDYDFAMGSGVVIQTTPAQDVKAENAIDKAIKNPPNYNLYRQNCASFVETILNAAGVKSVPSTIFPDVLGSALVACRREILRIRVARTIAERRLRDFRPY